MDLDIASRLKAFPNAPAMARQVVLLANDSHAHLSQVADVISKDPSLAAKILLRRIRHFTSVAVRAKICDRP